MCLTWKSFPWRNPLSRFPNPGFSSFKQSWVVNWILLIFFQVPNLPSFLYNFPIGALLAFCVNLIWKSSWWGTFSYFVLKQRWQADLQQKNIFRRILFFFPFSSGCIFGRKFMKQFPWNVFGRCSYYKQPSYFAIDKKIYFHHVYQFSKCSYHKKPLYFDINQN